MVNRNFFRLYQRRQKGAVAIEFVFIFPVLFVICYATIAYALAFLTVQNMTYTSEEVLRKAIGSDLCIEEEYTDDIIAKHNCEILTQYNLFSSEMLLFSDAEAPNRYTTNSNFCTVDLICTLEIRAEPLTPVSIFGFTMLNLTDNKLVGRASLLF